MHIVLVDTIDYHNYSTCSHYPYFHHPLLPWDYWYPYYYYRHFQQHRSYHHGATWVKIFPDSVLRLVVAVVVVAAVVVDAVAAAVAAVVVVDVMGEVLQVSFYSCAA